MTNEFKLAGGTNQVLIKVLQFSQLGIVGLGCYLYFFKQLSIEQISILGALGGIIMVIIYSIKKYKVVGKVVIDSDKLMISSKDLTIDLPFNLIRRIGFNLKGQTRSRFGISIFQPVGYSLPNGTGNSIEIETDNKIYKLDVLLKYAVDSNSLDFQINKLIDLGLKVDKVQLPKIVGDFA